MALRQRLFDTMAKNWFGHPIPLPRDAIKQVYDEIQALGSTLLTTSNVDTAFKSQTKQFAILFFHEVCITISLLSWGDRCISCWRIWRCYDLCIMRDSLVQKGSYKHLLRECLSLYDITLTEMRARDVLQRSEPPNFLLRISEGSIETCGKVYLAIRNLIC